MRFLREVTKLSLVLTLPAVCVTATQGKSVGPVQLGRVQETAPARNHCTSTGDAITEITAPQCCSLLLQGSSVILSAPHCSSVLLCDLQCCSVLLSAAPVLLSAAPVLPCTPQCSSVLLECPSVLFSAAQSSSVLLCAPHCSSVLLCAAKCSSVLPSSAECCSKAPQCCSSAP